MTRERWADQGFTLVELLVAISLLALIAAISASTLHFGRRTLQSIDRAQHAEIAAALHRVFRAALKSSALESSPLSNQKLSGFFEGGPEQLTLVTASDPWTTNGGLFLTSFSVRLKGGSQRGELIVGRRLYRPNAPKSATEETHTLASDIEGISFRYYGAPAGASSSSWTDHWDGRDGLPLLVAVTVNFARKDFQADSATVVDLATDAFGLLRHSRSGP